MPIKNPKRKGSNNELKAKNQLEEQGWLVTKSSASLGVFDLWAIHPEYSYIRLIQVKTNRMPPPKERDEIAMAPTPDFAQKEIWIFIDGKPREPRILIWINNKWKEIEYA